MATANVVNSSDSKIEFIQFHKPSLHTGEYEISVSQEIHTKSDSKIPSKSFPAARRFFVLGDRFELKPEDVYSVFPPNGSLGDHSNIIPHVILTCSTLPWERTPWGGNVNPSLESSPWLLLLLFDQDEQPQSREITLNDLKTQADSRIRFPAFDPEPGQQLGDKVAVIDVKKTTLQDVMPAAEDLPFLAHVRQTKDADGSAVENAVIIGNRLPRRGAVSTVHLVSVEGRFNANGFDYQNAGDDDLIRLVCLNSWSFACADANRSLEGLLLGLNREPGVLRLPKNNSPEAERHLALGYVPLSHRFRQGDKTVSWYHGPFIPAQNTVETPLPARSADELARYDTTNGLFDVSYAAAWELGRLLALQSKPFSVGLYNWKRSHARCLKRDEQRLLHPHLPAYEAATQAEEIPDEITNWFRDLSKLRGVPFNYLAPDERALPPESIRFFQLDSAWIDCLLDGAFSVGRVTSAALEQDSGHETSPAANPHDRVTGFLLRSDAVSGWPGLLVDAYDGNDNPLETLRMERLSDNVLICLFAGEAKTVEFHLRPETVHFGLDPNETAGYSKLLRDSQGIVKQTLKVPLIPWRQETKRVIDISGLAQAIETALDRETRSQLQIPPITSAQFALQMIETSEKVRFQHTAS